MHNLSPLQRSSIPLVNEICAAQGGLDRWSSLTRIDVQLRVKPWLFLSKFLSPRQRTLTAQIDTKSTRAVLTPFPRPGFRGIYEGDAVRIESEEGRVVASLDHARKDSHRRFFWNDLNALYFFGYAFWNYTHAPFLFLQPGFDLAELPGKHVVLGRPCRRLRVRFPSNIPTHSTEQTFYFDRDGLLRRLDYTAEIFGRWTQGAHLVDEHRTFGGLWYPTHRWVHPRFSDRPMPGPLAIEGWIDGIDVSGLSTISS